MSRFASQPRRLCGLVSCVAVDELLARLVVHPFDEDCAAGYGRIVQSLGWSRTRIFDRMIAATAIVHDLTLVTMNGNDFRDIPGLSLEIWPQPPR